MGDRSEIGRHRRDRDKDKKKPKGREGGGEKIIGAQISVPSVEIYEYFEPTRDRSLVRIFESTIDGLKSVGAKLPVGVVSGLRKKVNPHLEQMENVARLSSELNLDIPSDKKKFANMRDFFESERQEILDLVRSALLENPLPKFTKDGNRAYRVSEVHEKIGSMSEEAVGEVDEDIFAQILPDNGSTKTETPKLGKKRFVTVLKDWLGKSFVPNQKFIERALKTETTPKLPVLEPKIDFSGAGEKLNETIDELFATKKVDMKSELEKFLSNRKSDEQDGEFGSDEKVSQRWDGEGGVDPLNALKQRWGSIKAKAERLSSGGVAKQIDEYDEKIAELLSNDQMSGAEQQEKILGVITEASQRLFGTDDFRSERNEALALQRQEEDRRNAGVNAMVKGVDSELETEIKDKSDKVIKKAEMPLSEVLARLPEGGRALRIEIGKALRDLPADIEEKKQKKKIIKESLIKLSRVLHQLPKMETYRIFYNKAVGDFGLDGTEVFQTVAQEVAKRFLPLTEGNKIDTEAVLREIINSGLLKEKTGVGGVEQDGFGQQAEDVIAGIEGMSDRLFNLGASGQKLMDDAERFLSSGGKKDELQNILVAVNSVLDNVFRHDEFYRLRDELFKINRDEDVDKLHELVGGKIIEEMLPLKEKPGMSRNKIEKAIKKIANEILRGATGVDYGTHASDGGGRHIGPDFQVNFPGPGEELVDMRKEAIEINPQEWQDLLYMIMVIQEKKRVYPDVDAHDLRSHWHDVAREKKIDLGADTEIKLDKYIIDNFK